MLKLVSYRNQVPFEDKIYSPKAHEHHKQLIEAYLQSHRIRNHSPRTINADRRLLQGWFKDHGSQTRPLYTWEAMKPVEGRRRIVNYGNALLEVQVANQTIRTYLGILRGYFAFVLEHPFVFDGDTPKRLSELYGPIEQPISEYDIPQHSYDGSMLGLPLDPERLYDFYTIIRNKYLVPSGYGYLTARNYAMAVLAGESGLRVEEIMHLEISKDLFFDSKKLQTRFAKATVGSGKRTRITLFTPLARDTIRYYLKNHRNQKRKSTTDYLFLSRTGRRLTYQTMHRAIKAMVKCAQKNGFPIADHFSWHWFRRIFATRFIERYPDRLSVLINLLGHVTQNTVHSYIHHSEAWVDKNIQETLEEINLSGY